jgi:hypothetical protein
MCSMGIEEPVGVAVLALGLGMYHTSISLIRGAMGFLADNHDYIESTFTRFTAQ